MSIVPINLYLLEQCKTSLILLRSKFVNFLIGSCLLVEELIGRECQHFQTPSSKLVVHFSETCVVFGGQGSLGGYVDNEDSFFLLVNGEGYVVAIDVIGFEVEERGGVAFVDAVFGLVVEHELGNRSHLIRILINLWQNAEIYTIAIRKIKITNTISLYYCYQKK